MKSLDQTRWSNSADITVLTDAHALLPLLSQLADLGKIRQIDYQFGQFIATQSHDLSKSNQAYLAWIAAMTSYSLGQGHVCLMLPSSTIISNTSLTSWFDIIQILGIYGERGKQLNQLLSQVDWLQLLNQATLVQSFVTAFDLMTETAQPLVFDGQRLYLQRYWHYENTLATKLQQLGESLPFDKALAQQQLVPLFEQLFARQYSYLFKELRDAEKNSKSTAVLRQRMVCDGLDVLESASQELDWPAIDQVLTESKHIEDLTALEQLVPLASCLNWQKVAAAIALTRRFAVISGGPGTGKTTTVTKLLAALIMQHSVEVNGVKINDVEVTDVAINAKPPIIKLVAPTGKAAARLTESISQALDSLAIDPQLKAHIPTEASTLHRLLGARPYSQNFRHHQGNPLHLDILVVDEASMIDLPMMFKLVDALPKHARLILLGDKDQLASVEAGAVLGDICDFQQLGYSREQANHVAQLTGFSLFTQAPYVASASQLGQSIADSLCVLQKSYRFDARSGIGQLAKAINAGDNQHIERVWQQDFTDIQRYSLDADAYRQMIQTMVIQYQTYLSLLPRVDEPSRLDSALVSGTDSNVESPTNDNSIMSIAKQALHAFSRCRLLCAVREGDFGVQGLNLYIEKALSAKKLIITQDETWYHGRPIMVSQNDHSLGLYNGDIGLCLYDATQRRLKVFFELPNGDIKSVLLSRVPTHETAYAMTIHKSQGSEFDYTIMVLPQKTTPILTRELIYTGVTRAKKKLDIYTSPDIFAEGVARKIERHSGLKDRLIH